MMKYNIFLTILPILVSAGENNLNIIHGTEVKPHSLPYVVAIKTIINETEKICGGSLISDSVIVTAARCVNDSSQVKVILGAHNLTVSEETQIIPDKFNIIVHNEFNGTKNDIALIKLDKPVKVNEAINTIKLPEPGADFTEKLGLVAGWGKVHETDENVSDVLRKMEVTLISTIICELPYFLSLDFTQICTTGTGEFNICNGDAGSPLVVDGVLAGVVSFITDFGCEVGLPAVYTRVSSFVDWIKKNS